MAIKMMTSRVSDRNSSIELLRIIAMLMIVAHHFAVHTTWPIQNHLSFNYYIVDILASFGKIGVALFFIISGYFLYSAKKFNWKKIFTILCPMWFYSILILIAFVSTQSVQIEWTFPLHTELAHMLFPFMTNTYWFVSIYIIVYLISPFIKRCLDSLNTEELLKLIGLLSIFIIVPNFFGFLVASTKFSLLEFPSAIFYMLVGYTIKRVRSQHYIKDLNRKALIVLLFSLLTLIFAPLMKYGLAKIGYTDIPKDLFWNIYSLPCMSFCTSLFIIFSEWNFYNKIINYVSSLVFGVYLIHDNIFVRTWLWSGSGVLKTASHFYDSKIHFLLYATIVILAVFIICLLIEAIRKKVFVAIEKCCVLKTKHVSKKINLLNHFED